MQTKRIKSFEFAAVNRRRLLRIANPYGLLMAARPVSLS